MGGSALPPVLRWRLFPALPTPRRQPARPAEAGNAPGQQHQKRPGEQPVAVTAGHKGQRPAEQTGKPEPKSAEPQSPSGTSPVCGADTGSADERQAQGKEKNDKRTVHTHLSDRSGTLRDQEGEGLPPAVSRLDFGASAERPPVLNIPFPLMKKTAFWQTGIALVTERLSGPHPACDLAYQEHGCSACVSSNGF